MLLKIHVFIALLVVSAADTEDVVTREELSTAAIVDSTPSELETTEAVTEADLASVTTEDLVETETDPASDTTEEEDEEEEDETETDETADTTEEDDEEEEEEGEEEEEVEEDEEEKEYEEEEEEGEETEEEEEEEEDEEEEEEEEEEEVERETERMLQLCKQRTGMEFYDAEHEEWDNCIFKCYGTVEQPDVTMEVVATIYEENGYICGEDQTCFDKKCRLNNDIAFCNSMVEGTAANLASMGEANFCGATCNGELYEKNEGEICGYDWYWWFFVTSSCQNGTCTQNSFYRK